MKSVVLCEGRDDHWFLAYYLHKAVGWDTVRVPWRNYRITARNRRQEVTYLEKGPDSVAVWCVGGKDSFPAALDTIFGKLAEDYPFDPIDSVVIVRDRDNDTTEEALATIQSWLPGLETLTNQQATMWHRTIDGYDVSIRVTPLVLPFSEEGAIETLLMRSIQEQSREGAVIVREANEYIARLLQAPEIGRQYLSHERLILKAKYAATLAATNPSHSTALFQDMVMLCPWETSAFIKTHFDVMVKAISSEEVGEEKDAQRCLSADR